MEKSTPPEPDPIVEPASEQRPSRAPGPPRRRRPHGIQFTFLIVVGILLLLEGYVRLVNHYWASPEYNQILLEVRAYLNGENGRFMPAPYVNYRLKPNYVLVLPGGATHINAQGWRDVDDFTSQPARGAYRIVCLGASTTYGTSVFDNSQTWPAQLELQLDRSPRPGGWRRIEVYNMGVGGYTSAEVLATLQWYALSLHPQMILVMSAANDVNPRLYPGLDASYSNYRKTWEDARASGLARLYLRSQLYLRIADSLGFYHRRTLQYLTENPRPPLEESLKLFAQSTPRYYRSNLESIVELARARGIRPVLMTMAHTTDERFMTPDPYFHQLEIHCYQPGVTEHNGVLRQLCADLNVDTIDLDKAMSGRAAYFKDPVHMVPYGQVVRATTIAGRLQSIIPPMPASDQPTTPAASAAARD